MSLVGAGVQRIGTHKRITTNTNHVGVANFTHVVYDAVLVWGGTMPTSIQIGPTFAVTLANIPVGTGVNRITLPGPYYAAANSTLVISVTGGSSWELEYFLTTQPS